MFSRFLLITEGTTEKVSQFVITLESVYKKLYFNEQGEIYNTAYGV